MQLLLRHKLLIGAATLAAAASAGGAYAATQSSTNPRQAFLNDVARRLHVSRAQLDSALKGAMIDRLNALVKSGRLTRAQANRIEQRLESGRLPFRFGAPGRHFGLRLGAAGALHAAAAYLGLSDAQLLRDLRSGQSAAQIANSRGKSVSGLEQAIITAEQAELARLVSAGLLTSAQEQRVLSRLPAKVDRLVNKKGLGRMPPSAGGPGGLVTPPAPAPTFGGSPPTT